MKQHPSIKITIPEPCTQPWDDMQPVQGGRHCAHCQKAVVDFTRFTDVQLLAYFRKNGIGCGQFRKDQVDITIREIEVPKSSWWARIAAGLLLAAGFSRMAEAQTTKHRAQTVQKNSTGSRNRPRQQLKEITVTAERYQAPIINFESPGRLRITGAADIEKSPTRTFTSHNMNYSDTAGTVALSIHDVSKRKTFWRRLKHFFR